MLRTDSKPDPSDGSAFGWLAWAFTVLVLLATGGVVGLLLWLVYSIIQWIGRH